MLWERTYGEADGIDACRALVEAWRSEANKVFVLKARDEIRDPRALFERLFPNLGRPAPLAEDGTTDDRTSQRTGQLWFEVRFDPKYPNAYRHSAAAQPLHTDGSYIPAYPNATLMACVANAGRGGETIFITAEELVSILREEDPALLDQLMADPLLHARSGDRRSEKVIRYSDGKYQVNWNYFCVDRQAESGRKALVEQFQSYLASSPRIRERLLPIKLQPGDAVIWKDAEVLHGRNAFEATEASERFLWKCAIDIGAI